MATVGQTLTSPETGWRRYDDTDSRIVYTGTWTTSSTDSGYYNSNCKCSKNGGDTIKFKFYGTKLRYIGDGNSAKPNNISISIDGVVETFSSDSVSGIYQRLNYEKLGLSLGVHSVVVTVPSGWSTNTVIDAIDIDSTGYLVHPILNQVSDIQTMNIGDCVLCKYVAGTSGAVGYFYELGVMDVASLLPITGSATPSGYFYFIKVANGLLIADRVIQHSISWDTLNSGKYVEGNRMISIPPLASNSENGYTITGSSEYSGFPARLLLQYGVPAGYTDRWLTASGSTGVAKITYTGYIDIFEYRMYSVVGDSTSGALRMAKNWIIEGSNDGEVTWTTIDTRTNQTGWVDGTPRDYKCQNPGSYKCIRLTVTANNGDAQLEIARFWIFGKNKIRSLSGGCAFVDANGNLSTTDLSLGSFPVNNEWDKYIRLSTLNGKITAGDNGVWNWSGMYALCRETPTIGIGANTIRIHRGGNSIAMGVSTLSSSTHSSRGFRPVLEYIDDSISENKRPTTLFY